MKIFNSISEHIYLNAGLKFSLIAGTGRPKVLVITTIAGIQQKITIRSGATQQIQIRDMISVLSGHVVCH